jgi:hypothetical protein
LIDRAGPAPGRLRKIYKGGKPEERTTGIARVEEKIRNVRAEGLLERRYGDPDLREDLDYAAWKTG